MEKIYSYQKSFFVAKLFLLLFFGVLILLSWLPLLISILMYGAPYVSSLKAVLYVNCSALFVVILLLVIRKEIRGTRFIIAEDRLIKKTPYRTSTIRLDSISQFSFKRIPLMKGFAQLSSPDGSILLPFYIENFASLVHDLRAVLQTTNGTQRVFNEQSISHLEREALINDLARNRAARAFPALSTSIILTVMGGMIVAETIWELPWVGTLTWGINGFLFPVIAYFVADYRISKAYRFFLKSETIQEPETEAIYISTGLLVFLLYLIWGIFFQVLYLQTL